METTTSERHLTDAELFALAAPAVGEPEALPRHLSGCQRCSRALQEWKGAVRALAEEDIDELNARSPEQWRAAEQATMAVIRRAGRSRRRFVPLRWVVGIAATLVVVALAMPLRRSTPAAVASAPPISSDTASLSVVDREDDALLRDVDFLAQGGDGNGDPFGEDSL